MLAKAESLGIDTTLLTDERGDPSFTFYMIACVVLSEAHGMTHEGAHCQDCAEIAHTRRNLTQIAGLDEAPAEWEEILRESQFWWPELAWPEGDDEASDEVAEALCLTEQNHVCLTAHRLEEVIFEPTVTS